ncbi:MAG: hypothetical protein Ta2C_07210 [Candidatus Endomicrobiellum trichonymphae]|uniref:hypothetical protein n=1 Tax=Endomicrobium trichonymphae TaxID=1408204 RepID=UPI0027D3F5E3|nr:MAG: hypothetical protein Ta2C_07210 [Candidatus Endomicrobium trichonymphae]
MRKITLILIVELMIISACARYFKSPIPNRFQEGHLQGYINGQAVLASSWYATDFEEEREKFEDIVIRNPIIERKLLKGSYDRLNNKKKTEEAEQIEKTKNK